MATATEAVSLNKTECDQLPTWKYKSSPILSVFQQFSLQHVLCYKAGLGTLPVSPSSYTQPYFIGKVPLYTVSSTQNTEMGERSISYILKH